jgi:small GTP-binding protein
MNSRARSNLPKQLIVPLLRDLAVLIGERATYPVTFGAGEPLLPGLGLTDQARRLSSQADDLVQAEYKVFVAGRFKTGKTTLINALLGQVLLPTSALPTTAIIARVVFGYSKKVAIYEYVAQKPRYISYENFSQEYSLSLEDEDDQKKNVNYALFELPSPLLEYGITLIDSPGLNEAAFRDNLTHNYSRQADAILFVISALSTLSMSEIEHLTELIQHNNPGRIFLVVNHMDSVRGKREKEMVKEHVRKRLLDYFGVDGKVIENRLFFVDALTALKARMESSANTEMLEHSGVLSLEAELKRFVIYENFEIKSSIQTLRKVIIDALHAVSQLKISNKSDVTTLTQSEHEQHSKDLTDDED